MRVKKVFGRKGRKRLHIAWAPCVQATAFKMAAGMVKNFLYAFCGKKKTQPLYNEKPSKGGKFYFQVSA